MSLRRSAGSDGKSNAKSISCGSRGVSIPSIVGTVVPFPRWHFLYVRHNGSRLKEEIPDMFSANPHC